MTRLSRWVVVSVAGALTAVSGAGMAQNFGSPEEVAAVVAALRADGSPGDKIEQVIVDGAYAVAEVHREGDKSVSTEALTLRGNRLRRQTPGWHTVGGITGVPPPCWLEQYGYPQNVAHDIANKIPAMRKLIGTRPKGQCS